MARQSLLPFGMGLLAFYDDAVHARSKKPHWTWHDLSPSCRPSVLSAMYLQLSPQKLPPRATCCIATDDHCGHPGRASCWIAIPVTEIEGTTVSLNNQSACGECETSQPTLPPDRALNRASRRYDSSFVDVIRDSKFRNYAPLIDFVHDVFEKYVPTYARLVFISSANPAMRSC
jgi:hypothetical protein